MTEKVEKYEVKAIDPLICIIRGQKVILDYELAAIYGVSTKRLNEQVKRNADRFPDDFAFRLTPEEFDYLKSQIATSNSKMNRSQIATGLQRHRDPRLLPYAFTEHGALMVANVLRSKRAIQMSVFVVRAFIRMRQMLISQQDLARKLVKLEKQLTSRLDVHEVAITEVLQQIMRWLNPPQEPEPPKKKIGFLVEEQRTSYIYILKAIQSEDAQKEIHFGEKRIKLWRGRNPKTLWNRTFLMTDTKMQKERISSPVLGRRMVIIGFPFLHLSILNLN